MELIFLLITAIIVICYDVYKSYDNDYIHSNPKNYCSYFPEGNWGECCYQHDADCMLALEYLSYDMRLEADTKLFQCVFKKNKFIAFIMYAGVRIWANTFWWIGYWRERNAQQI
jgi:hypothetical protein